MMNRKLAVSLALALGMSAAGAAYAASPFNGPYVGAQVGYSVYDTKGTFADPGGTLTLDGASASGADGGVYGGWGMLFSPTWYGGLEAEYNWSGAEHTTTASSGGSVATLSYKDKDNYGISARLGWLPSSNVMLYGRAGWQRLSMDYTAGVAGLGSSTTSEDHNGFRAGVGAEVAMTSNWLMRLDYSHTSYNKKTLEPGVYAEPSNDLFRVGLAYRF